MIKGGTYRAFKSSGCCMLLSQMAAYSEHCGQCKENDIGAEGNVAYLREADGNELVEYYKS